MSKNRHVQTYFLGYEKHKTGPGAPVFRQVTTYLTKAEIRQRAIDQELFKAKFAALEEVKA